jgi:hypothetical protein
MACFSTMEPAGAGTGDGGFDVGAEDDAAAVFGAREGFREWRPRCRGRG